MEKIIYLLMMLFTISIPTSASNESSIEKVGVAFISGLIFSLGALLFNWIKSKRNKSDDNYEN
jgi:hypothetical protein